MYYKVVTKNLKSAIVQDDWFTVDYKVGTFVVGDYPLFVFETLKDSKDFLKREQMDGLIFESEVQNPRKINVIMSSILVGCYTDTGILRDFWREYNAGKINDSSSYPFRKPPGGTVICDAVKLIREAL